MQRKWWWMALKRNQIELPQNGDLFVTASIEIDNLLDDIMTSSFKSDFNTQSGSGQFNII